MFNELTEVDIRKMQEEIDYRMRVVRPKCVEDLKTARAFGDLSENYEYKAAKQELRRCDSRLRYLKKMIETAKVIKADSQADQVGLFDTVDVYFEDDDEVERLRIMTTLREDVLNGIISKESPMGKALMGRRVGDRVLVKVSDDVSYYVQIRALEKGSDDDTLSIRSF
ncbi:MAG: GreA/GreB family elongation factor [Kiritimatiellia bacterium]